MRARAEQLALNRAVSAVEAWDQLLGRFMGANLDALQRSWRLPVPFVTMALDAGIRLPNVNERNLLVKSLRASGFDLDADDMLTFNGRPTAFIHIAPTNSLTCWCGAKTSNDDHTGKPYCDLHQCAGTLATTLPHCAVIQHSDGRAVWYCETCYPGGEVYARTEVAPSAPSPAPAPAAAIILADASDERDSDDEADVASPARPARKRVRDADASYTPPLAKKVRSISGGQVCGYQIGPGVRCTAPATVPDATRAAAHCEQHQCAWRKRDGTRCDNKAQFMRPYCFNHSQKQ